LRALAWNLRGFGRLGRRTQLRDFFLKKKEGIDIICLQETMKQSFDGHELRSLDIEDRFHWSWLPAMGHSRGMLLGFHDSTLEVGSIDQGRYFISTLVYHIEVKFKFDYIGVYGLADHSKSAEFFEELETKVSQAQHPVVVRGDFNLIRGAEDKNNNNLNWPIIHMFDDFLARLALREFRRTGARFTWTNKLNNTVLDRVFVSP
jgi:endonuclease/exonuclease/phosphatase family metal-dependent hydrolase